MVEKFTKSDIRPKDKCSHDEKQYDKYTDNRPKPETVSTLAIRTLAIHASA